MTKKFTMFFLTILIAIGAILPIRAYATELQDFQSIYPLEFREICKEGKPVIIDYGSEGCPPCRAMKQFLISFYDAHKHEALIRFVDAWDTPKAAANVPLKVIPTQIFFSPNGKPYEPSPQLQEKFHFIRYIHKQTKEMVFLVHEGGLTRQDLEEILKEMQKQS